MPRTKRRWISQEAGSFHIISHTARDNILFTDDEKEHFFTLLKRFASGFYVNIHAFCIMGTHFHILATGMELAAQKAPVEDLYRRYRLIYGKNAEPPTGSYDSNYYLVPDEDSGVERLRDRLGSISRFVQELKQTFSKWYNEKHNRRGFLWGDRFKGVLVEKGESQLACSAYIDLNPVRANLVERPEDYRWNTLGLRARNPKVSNQLLTWIFAGDEKAKFPRSDFLKKKNETDWLSWYREFVYISGGIERKGKGKISRQLVKNVKECHGRLGIEARFKYRLKNISEGIAIGSFSFIAGIQRKYNRKFIRPRPFMPGKLLFATRVLRI